MTTIASIASSSFPSGSPDNPAAAHPTAAHPAKMQIPRTASSSRQFEASASWPGEQQWDEQQLHYPASLREKKSCQSMQWQSSSFLSASQGVLR